MEFKASTKELKVVLDRVFKKIHVEDVVIPLKDGRSCGYGFVTLSWAKGSTIDPDNICKVYSGKLNVNSRPIYLRELNSKDNDSVSSSFSWLLARQTAILARLEELERQEAAPIQLNLPEWDPAQKGIHDTCAEIAQDQPLRRGD